MPIVHVILWQLQMYNLKEFVILKSYRKIFQITSSKID